MEMDGKFSDNIEQWTIEEVFFEIKRLRKQSAAAIDKELVNFIDAMLMHKRLESILIKETKKLLDDINAPLSNQSQPPHVIDNKGIHELEAHLIASIHFINSMADILDQIINITILKRKYPEEQVHSGNIHNALSSLNTASKVDIARENLHSSAEFNYIQVFCNVVKHRSIIMIKEVDAITSIRANKIELAPIFESFNYKNKRDRATKRYPATSSSDIIDKLDHNIILITKVGVEIINFIKYKC
jgi:hypothetical protein